MNERATYDLYHVVTLAISQIVRCLTAISKYSSLLEPCGKGHSKAIENVSNNPVNRGFQGSTILEGLA